MKHTSNVDDRKYELEPLSGYMLISEADEHRLMYFINTLTDVAYTALDSKLFLMSENQYKYYNTLDEALSPDVVFILTPNVSAWVRMSMEAGQQPGTRNLVFTELNPIPDDVSQFYIDNGFVVTKISAKKDAENKSVFYAEVIRNYNLMWREYCNTYNISQENESAEWDRLHGLYEGSAIGFYNWLEHTFLVG